MHRLKAVGRHLVIAALILSPFFVILPLGAQTLPESLWNGMKWRSIGPFRGGRVLAHRDGSRACANATGIDGLQADPKGADAPAPGAL